MRSPDRFGNALGRWCASKARSVGKQAHSSSINLSVPIIIDARFSSVLGGELVVVVISCSVPSCLVVQRSQAMRSQVLCKGFCVESRRFAENHGLTRDDSASSARGLAPFLDQILSIAGFLLISSR